jgi:hypothetical protein
MAIVDTSTLTTKKLTFANATSSFKTYNDLIYSPIAGGTGITTLGTVTTGTWNATAISVAKGGTGTTTFASNYVLLGDGTSGVKTVSGQGTSGYLLTSNGAGSAPTWQNVAVALNTDNTWTGLNTFTASTTHTATTTIPASNVLSNALIINNVPYQYPSTQCASGQSLVNNGSGVLSCKNINKYSYAGVGPNASTGSATTTVIVIPAGTMTASSTIEVDWNGTSLYNGGGGTIYLSAGSTTVASASCSEGTNGETAQCIGHFLVSFNSVSSQNYAYNQMTALVGANTTVNGSYSTASVDFTNAVTLVVWALAANASNNMNVTSLAVTVNP